MVVNDNAPCLNDRGIQTFFASRARSYKRFFASIHCDMYCVLLC